MISVKIQSKWYFSLWDLMNIWSFKNLKLWWFLCCSFMWLEEEERVDSLSLPLTHVGPTYFVLYAVCFGTLFLTMIFHCFPLWSLSSGCDEQFCDQIWTFWSIRWFRSVQPEPFFFFTTFALFALLFLPFTHLFTPTFFSKKSQKYFYLIVTCLVIFFHLLFIYFALLYCFISLFISYFFYFSCHFLYYHFSMYLGSNVIYFYLLSFIFMPSSRMYLGLM